MSDLNQKLLERYESKRAVRLLIGISEPDLQLRSYRQAAAVLHQFVPEALRPLAPEYFHENPRIFLFDDIVRISGERSDGLFTLKPEVRKQALGQFSSRTEMRKALKVNPDRLLTPIQKMWEDYLTTGSLPLPESLGYYQLINLCQILSWLNNTDKSLPDQTYVLGLVRRKSVLASFEHLVISNFTGRVEELTMLRDHIGALPTTTGVEDVIRRLADWLKAPHKPILAIYGPGGIGKSALIGRMLWENTQAEPQARILFAYLAFDQETLRVEAPFTILVEAAAQFELQLPEQTDPFNHFNDFVRKFRDARGALGDRKEVKSSRKARLDEVQTIDNELYSAFASLLMVIGTRTYDNKVVKNPVLLVLDTFEEVQYRDQESLAGFWRMLNIIQTAYPPFRVIISGRASVSSSGLDTKHLEEKPLLELSMPDRVSLLGSLGVLDIALAEAVAQQVGGSPLSLRLAANVIASHPEAVTSKGIKDLSTRKWLFFQVDEQLIQGQLYRRILDHIHDENVRKLAHPGMVLRRVSPDIILKVLAPLCQIPVNSLVEAERLFNDLKREHALVQSGESGTLIYRPEIRQAMVRLLEQDKFSEVWRLHRAAIDYYSNKEGVEARAEEIYHRLVLGEDELWRLDSMWMNGIEHSIAASLDEYPDQAKAWLASRMNLEVPRSVFQNADIFEWERNIYRKVQRALSELQTDWALELLGERAERSEASPLFALEAKTHLLSNNLDQAQAVLEKAIERVSNSNNRGRLAELFWLQSQVAILRDEPENGDRLLEQAEKAIEKASNPVPLMHILCHRLLLREKFHVDYNDTAAQIRVRLNHACERNDESSAFSAPYVLQLAMTLLGNEFPKTTERLSPFITFQTSLSEDPLTSENLQGLEEYREPWEREHNPSSEALA